jgi:hypothetical protein
MWNRFISSPYAHFATAVALTFGLALVLLTAHPRTTGFVAAGYSGQSAPSRTSTGRSPQKRDRGKPAVLRVAD